MVGEVEELSLKLTNAPGNFACQVGNVKRVVSLRKSLNDYEKAFTQSYVNFAVGQRLFVSLLIISIILKTYVYVQ